MKQLRHLAHLLRFSGRVVEPIKSFVTTKHLHGIGKASRFYMVLAKPVDSSIFFLLNEEDEDFYFDQVPVSHVPVDNMYCILLDTCGLHPKNIIIYISLSSFLLSSPTPTFAVKVNLRCRPWAVCWRSAGAQRRR